MQQPSEQSRRLPSTNLLGPIEAYSYDLHVIGAIQDSQQVAQMTLDDWWQAQEADPVLGIIIKRLREGDA